MLTIKVLQLCEVDETRAKLLFAFESRCSENVATLEEAIKLRCEAAQLMGYQNHAEYVLEVRMAKKPEQVMEVKTIK